MLRPLAPEYIDWGPNDLRVVNERVAGTRGQKSSEMGSADQAKLRQSGDLYEGGCYPIIRAFWHLKKSPGK